EATMLELEGEVTAEAPDTAAIPVPPHFEAVPGDTPDLDLDLEDPLELVGADAIEELPSLEELPLLEELPPRRDPTTKEALNAPGRATSMDGPASPSDRPASTAVIRTAEQPVDEDDGPWSNALEQAVREALDVDVLPPIEGPVGASEAAWLGA